MRVLYGKRNPLPEARPPLKHVDAPEGPQGISPLPIVGKGVNHGASMQPHLEAEPGGEPDDAARADLLVEMIVVQGHEEHELDIVERVGVPEQAFDGLERALQQPLSLTTSSAVPIRPSGGQDKLQLVRLVSKEALNQGSTVTQAVAARVVHGVKDLGGGLKQLGSVDDRVYHARALEPPVDVFGGVVSVDFPEGIFDEELHKRPVLRKS